jgi:hypothetical protein
MCPLCLSTLGWIVAGGASAGAGVLIARPRKKGREHDDHDRN